MLRALVSGRSRKVGQNELLARRISPQRMAAGIRTISPMARNAGRLVLR